MLSLNYRKLILLRNAIKVPFLGTKDLGTCRLSELSSDVNHKNILANNKKTYN